MPLDYNCLGSVLFSLYFLMYLLNIFHSDLLFILHAFFALDDICCGSPLMFIFNVLSWPINTIRVLASINFVNETMVVCCSASSVWPILEHFRCYD
jgi:hypothetical protein